MNEKDGRQIPQVTEDHFLHSLVNMSEKGLRLPVTLSVGGMLISGVIIPSSEYMQLFGDALGTAFPDVETSQAIKNSFVNLSDSIKLEEERRENDLPPAYIHLKEAKIFLSVAPGIPTNSSVLWRGKISSVDGFSLGQLST